MVDDEEELIATLAERFSMSGIPVTRTIDYRAVLDLMENLPVDIALDVRLPGMKGLELKRLT